VIKVTDFGLVHAIKSETFESEILGDEVHNRFSVLSRDGICGTPFYMSPEQLLQGSKLLKQLGVLKEIPEVPSLDLRSDLYVFGCALYAMVKKHPPFWELSFNLSRYCSQTLYEEPGPINSGDREFDHLIIRLLQKAQKIEDTGVLLNLRRPYRESTSVQ
jgi:serine/threonine protein kinase